MGEGRGRGLTSVVFGVKMVVHICWVWEVD